jgi:hypothetical protein
MEDSFTLLNVEWNVKHLMKRTCIKKLILPSQKLKVKQVIRILFDMSVLRGVPGSDMALGYRLGSTAALMVSVDHNHSFYWHENQV